MTWFLRRVIVIAVVLTVASLFGSSEAPADETRVDDGGYNPIQAGFDAYAYHERLRLNQVNRHLWLLDQMRWWSSFPRGAGYFFRPAPGLDAVYAYGAAGRDWGGDVFSPWPIVPGDLYGYRIYGGVPQSIGQRHVQTGPNRWESHPVYPEDLVTRPPAPAPLARPAPSPEEPRPADRPAAVPVGRSGRRGPVEF
jgi:hypothetical protein